MRYEPITITVEAPALADLEVRMVRLAQDVESAHKRMRELFTARQNEQLAEAVEAGVL